MKKILPTVLAALALAGQPAYDGGDYWDQAIGYDGCDLCIHGTSVFMSNTI